MSDTVEDDLEKRLVALLEPGDISLAGLIVHTDFERQADIEVHEATVEIGNIIAEHAGVSDWYVYSGNDDTSFASNQHQGLSLPDESFVWECQHLVRDGTFDMVFYYESVIEQDALVQELEKRGYRITSVPSPDR